MLVIPNLVVKRAKQVTGGQVARNTFNVVGWPIKFNVTANLCTKWPSIVELTRRILWPCLPRWPINRNANKYLFCGYETDILYPGDPWSNSIWVQCVLWKTFSSTTDNYLPTKLHHTVPHTSLSRTNGDPLMARNQKMASKSFSFSYYHIS